MLPSTVRVTPYFVNPLIMEQSCLNYSAIFISKAEGADETVLSLLKVINIGCFMAHPN